MYLCHESCSHNVWLQWLLEKEIDAGQLNHKLLGFEAAVAIPTRVARLQCVFDHFDVFSMILTHV
jgi:hypothetical protein